MTLLSTKYLDWSLGKRYYSWDSERFPVTGRNKTRFLDNNLIVWCRYTANLCTVGWDIPKISFCRSFKGRIRISKEEFQLKIRAYGNQDN